MSKYDCLKIYKSPYPKIRIGKNNDGGYVICDIDQNYDLFIAGGIADDISFELDLLKLYPKLICHAFDGSIDQLPSKLLALKPDTDQWIPVKDHMNEWIQIGNKVHEFGISHTKRHGPPHWGGNRECNMYRQYLGIMTPNLTIIPNPHTLTWLEAIEQYPNLTTTHDILHHHHIYFSKRFLGQNNNKTTSNLRDYMDHNNDIFMKLDIEGGEVPLFASFSDNDLKKIKQLVIEFHDPISVEIQQRLSKTHWLVHIHANNVGTILKIGGVVIPYLYECTYIRKKEGEILPLNNVQIPTDIDQPNNPLKSEIILNGYPYVHSC